MINKLNVNDTFHDCVRNADFKIISVNQDNDTFMVQGIVNEEIVSQKKMYWIQIEGLIKSGIWRRY